MQSYIPLQIRELKEIRHNLNIFEVCDLISFSTLMPVSFLYCLFLFISSCTKVIWIEGLIISNSAARPVARILCGGGGGANEAKVDQTTEMKVAIHEKL